MESAPSSSNGASTVDRVARLLKNRANSRECRPGGGAAWRDHDGSDVRRCAGAGGDARPQRRSGASADAGANPRALQPAQGSPSTSAQKWRGRQRTPRTGNAVVDSASQSSSWPAMYNAAAASRTDAAIATASARTTAAPARCVTRHSAMVAADGPRRRLRGTGLRLNAPRDQLAQPPRRRDRVRPTTNDRWCPAASDAGSPARARRQSDSERPSHVRAAAASADAATTARRCVPKWRRPRPASAAISRPGPGRRASDRARPSQRKRRHVRVAPAEARQQLPVRVAIVFARAFTRRRFAQHHVRVGAADAEAAHAGDARARAARPRRGRRGHAIGSAAQSMCGIQLAQVEMRRHAARAGARAPP